MKILDLHCDTISVIHNNKGFSLNNPCLQVSVDKLKKGNYIMQCFAMFIPYTLENPLEECIQMTDTFYKQLELYPDIEIVRSYSDIVKNDKNNKISALLTIEEGGVTKGNLSYLRTFYRLGVRMICLNWNFVNGVGYPNIIKGMNSDPLEPNTTQGLTDYGKSMVVEMQKLGMIVDVSHLSDKGFWDVLALAKKPIVASHSNCRAVCKHVRNLTDEMIIALKENGGVMGMNFCADFLSDSIEIGKNTIDCVLRHIWHIKKLVGVDVIALGSDFDGIDPDIELKGADLMPMLVHAMKDSGLTEEEIEKITYKNALRVIQANLS